MRTDLSFESFAAVLAALGATTSLACTGASSPPLQPKVVTPAISPVSEPTHAASSPVVAPALPAASSAPPQKASPPDTEASCGAGGCCGDPKKKIL